MEPDYKWIAQDANGEIWKYTKKAPRLCKEIWQNKDFLLSTAMTVANGDPNPNWRDSLIDLEKEDYEIIDGILVRKPRARKKLTDTKLLDAIVEHELRVDVNGNEVEVISGSIPGAVTINKKGNIRKAIKKWLRKNVDTKPVENEKTYNLQIHDGAITEVFLFQDKSEFKKHVESL